VKDIKEKFQRLRTHYAREIKKNKPLPSGSGADNPTTVSKWLHFQRLGFLKDCLVPKSSQSNMDSSADGRAGVSMENDDSSIDEMQLPHFPRAFKKKKSPIKRHDEAPDEKRQLLGTLQKIGTNILTAKDDDCDLFGKQIALALRDLHPYHKDLAKVDILMTVNRYKYFNGEQAPPVSSCLSHTPVTPLSHASPSTSPQASLLLPSQSVPYSNHYYA
jgi:hypothetical protein